MSMMVVMNKRKYDSLPEEVKKVIDDTTGLVMSQEAGKVYDDTNEPMKNLCMKKGMQVLQLPEAEKQKLEALSKPLRDKWVQEMEAKGMPGKAILDAAEKLTNE
jgi:TRAP-type C4-dicarboxylate transport system substrate-binding protein